MDVFIYTVIDERTMGVLRGSGTMHAITAETTDEQLRLVAIDGKESIDVIRFEYEPELFRIRNELRRGHTTADIMIWVRQLFARRANTEGARAQ